MSNKQTGNKDKEVKMQSFFCEMNKTESKFSPRSRANAFYF